MSQIFAETMCYPDTLNRELDFYVNDSFYLLAPPYYQTFYSIFLKGCLEVYDARIAHYYNRNLGFAPQKMVQSIVTGMNNMLFAFGGDFSADEKEYKFITQWAKKSKFFSSAKKAHLFAGAGGTSLLKLNRSGADLFTTAHRIDTFFVDVDANGNVEAVKVYLDAITNTVPSGNGSQIDKHYCICEDRYFNRLGIPCSKVVCYEGGGNLQTEVTSRSVAPKEATWSELPRTVKKFIKKNYPSVIVGRESWLPFKDSLGCFLLKYNEGIPSLPNMPFGQPVADIIMDDSFQYDQLNYFSKNEVDLARARALIPEDMWNKDDPNYDDTALSERFYQAVSTLGDDSQITPIQFNMRADQIKVQRETILKNVAFKLNMSASSIASFLDEGQGAMTATQIISERTKSDTWLKSQIGMVKPILDDIIHIVMRYYGYGDAEVILKAEDQSPFLELFRAYNDSFSAGNMSEEAFVKKVHKDMTESEQRREIEWLKAHRPMAPTNVSQGESGITTSLI